MPDEGADVSLAETPQAEGLSRLKAEVDALVDEATALEAELREEQERLDRFQVDYVARVAPLMARVELLEAQLAGERGEITNELIDRAEQAARVASEQPPEPPQRPTVDPGWKKRKKDWFRSLARRLHPDLAASEEDRERRTELMGRLNEAWEQGDEAAMAILDAEALDLVDESASVGDRLATLTKSRDALEERVRSLKTQLDELRGSGLELLRQQADEAREQGRDLLADLVAELDQRAEALEAELAEVAA